MGIMARRRLKAVKAKKQRAASKVAQTTQDAAEAPKKKTGKRKSQDGAQ